MKKLIITVIALFFTTVAYMQTTIPKAQSLFIYNFSRLIEWPASAKAGPFVIGILGNSEVTDELLNYTKGMKVGQQSISVVQFKTPAEITNCQILFIPFSHTKQISEVLGVLNGKNTLIITEKSGALAEGAAINFVIQEDKMRFELKPENAQKYGIKFSSKLEEMAMKSM